MGRIRIISTGGVQPTFCLFDTISYIWTFMPGMRPGCLRTSSPPFSTTLFPLDISVLSHFRAVVPRTALELGQLESTLMLYSSYSSAVMMHT